MVRIQTLGLFSKLSELAHVGWLRSFFVLFVVFLARKVVLKRCKKKWPGRTEGGGGERFFVSYINELPKIKLPT